MNAATATASSIIQPPSERDWEVYRLVRVEQRSTRAVAKVAGISQTRVCQVVERTAAFVVETTPALTKEDEAQRITVARQLAAERIDYMIALALRSFRQSLCVEKVIRQEGGVQPKTTIRQNFGEVRYLHTASRLALLAAELPPPTRSSAEFASIEQADEPIAEPIAQSIAQRDEAQNPPQGDCSPDNSGQPTEPSANSTSTSATAAAMLSCVAEARAQKATDTIAARPVQPHGSSSKPSSKTSQLTPRQAIKRQEFFQTG